MNGIKDNSTWQMALKALQPENITQKIEANYFSGLSDKEKKALLCKAFAATFIDVNGQGQGNLACFIAGHEDNTPSMVFDSKQGHFHCYGCMGVGENYDLFDVLKSAYGYKYFSLSYEKAIDLYIDEPEKIATRKPSSTSKDLIPKEMFKTAKNPYYTPIQNDPNGIEYLNMRGISQENAKQHFVMTWEYQGALYLVFINDNGTVVRRHFATTPDAKGYSNSPSKWWNQKGEGGFFNLRVIEKVRQNERIVFVTESAIDALSVLELGFPAVGLNSVNKAKAFINAADYKYICALFDTDIAGQSAATTLSEYGVYAAEYKKLPFLSQHKDINEALVADREQTRADLATLVELAKYFYSEGVLSNG